MAHRGTVSPNRRILDSEWLPLMGQVTQVVNTWSGRRDLVAYVGEDGGQGVAPAFYDPASAEIEVNSKIAFGEDTAASAVDDFTLRDTHFEWPKAAGAVLHEAMHAKHTSYDLRAAYKELGYKTYTFALAVLEESRIEARGVRAFPDNAVFLRACAMSIVLSDMTDEEIKKLSGIRQAVHLAALSLARVDAGVLTKKDMKKTRRKLIDILGADLLGKLRGIWREFQTLSDTDTTRMYELAREWERLQEEKAEEEGEPMEGEAAGEFVIVMDKNGMPQSVPGGAGGEGEPSEGEGEGQSMDDAMAQAIADMFKAMSEDAAQSEVDSRTAIDDTKANEQAKKEAKARQAAQDDQEATERTAKKVFNHEIGPNGSTSSQLKDRRTPTSEERVAANRIASDMRRARYRDHILTERMSATPPGRLNTGVAMQAKAIRQRGGQFVAEPFKQKQRHNVEDPKLTLGIMCDISGSMSATMRPMATSTWVMQEAIRRIEGTAAAVYYGDSVFPTLKPGQHLEKVVSYSAEDGSEAFDEAFRALDGTLNLINGSGARMVINCSDGQYTGAERVACEKWLRACKRAGVAVVWLGYGGTSYWGGGFDKSICEETGAQYVQIENGDVLGAATAIGRACVKALTSASA